MTRQRNDEHSTEFGLWLRRQNVISSREGYTAINLDYVWRNYKTDQYMLLEEKRFMSNLTKAHVNSFKMLDEKLSIDPNYFGFHLVQFEKTNPDDGKVFVDGVLFTVVDLYLFLMFGSSKEVYVSYFEKLKNF